MQDDRKPPRSLVPTSVILIQRLRNKDHMAHLAPVLTAALLTTLTVREAGAGEIRFATSGVGESVPATYPMYKNVGAELSYDADSGVYSLDGWGHRPDDGWDMMGFAHLEQGPGDFSMSLRVLSLPDCPYLNFGLTAREGLVGNERMVFLKWNASSSTWQWYQRKSPGALDELNCPEGYRKCWSQGMSDPSAPLNLHIRLSRKDGVFEAALSEDGEQWKPLSGPVFRLESQNVFLGVGMSCGNKGAARGIATFDSVRWSGAPAPIEKPEPQQEPDAGAMADAPDVGAGGQGGGMDSQPSGGGAGNSGSEEPEPKPSDAEGSRPPGGCSLSPTMSGGDDGFTRVYLLMPLAWLLCRARRRRAPASP